MPAMASWINGHKYEAWLHEIASEKSLPSAIYSYRNLNVCVHSKTILAEVSLCYKRKRYWSRIYDTKYISNARFQRICIQNLVISHKRFRINRTRKKEILVEIFIKIELLLDIVIETI